MIIHDPEESEAGVVAHAVRAPDSDQHYAVVGSGANPIIVRLHPALRGEIAMPSPKHNSKRTHIWCKSLST